ncbi:BQ5605_C009g05797 [Microbotryum silenes-dioicae]|uniref:BQ5605_C009g05797 protein n=1 Tax=Microbotryum silenes-dioicae TaxID=796604 RepID=A0A2X0MDY3_9BASI|nr:BQ5605_C009g05797 [Microbotryum silenes-dioicae]
MDQTPVASTSASASTSPAPFATGSAALEATHQPPQAVQSEAPTPSFSGAQKKASTGTKRRKLPSCDSCRLRRVLCVPVPPPGSCSRCLEKGIICTSTPVIRKKPVGRTGRRIEEARAMFGATEAGSSNSAPAENQPWLGSSTFTLAENFTPIPSVMGASSSLPTVSANDLDSRLGLTQLSGELVAHLLGLYQALPQSWLPLLPRARITTMFEASGRRLSSLPPQAEVLAYTIMALTSRLSSHPYILGDGPPAPAFESLTSQSLKERPDLQAFGARRDAVCEKMRAKAVQLAWERGTLVEASEETMASCHLLDILESRTNTKKGVPYVSAFVTHLRTLLDERDTTGGMGKIIHQPLGWAALIMREALAALRTGGRSHFMDDEILVGPVPPSIEEALLQTVDDIDVRDSVSLFFRPMRPYMYHVTRLARECTDRVTCKCNELILPNLSPDVAWVRNRPLDEAFVSKYLAQLDSLERLLLLLSERIAFSLSPAATSAHALPAPFETERRYIMTSCIHTLRLAWASLILPLCTNLKRRLSMMEVGTISPEQRRTRDRLLLLRRHAQQGLVKGARMIAACLDSPPSLGYLTHVQQERIDNWADVLLDSTRDDDVISQEEQFSDLQTILAGLKMIGWSWPDNAQLIGSLEERLNSMEIGDSGRARAAAITSISTLQASGVGNAAQAGGDDLCSFPQYLATPSPPQASTGLSSATSATPTCSFSASPASMEYGPIANVARSPPDQRMVQPLLPLTAGVGSDPSWGSFGDEFNQMLDDGTGMNPFLPRWS